MTHDPELAAASYLAGALGRRARSRFESHMLGCDDCWAEVGAGRFGRSVAESGRESAPTQLRDRIRAVVEHAATERANSRRGSLAGRFRVSSQLMAGLTATAAVVVSVGVLLTGGLGHQTPGRREPRVLAAALTAYRAATLPGKTMTQASVPDLSGLGLSAIGASAGRLDTMPVDAYGYRDSTGTRVVVYFGRQSFPRPDNAHSLGSLAGPWSVHAAGVFMECSKANHVMLVVGADEHMVAAVERVLAVA